MSSFDLNNVNSYTPQQVQSPISVNNRPKEKDKVELPPIKTENPYIEERTIASILREKNINVTRKRLEIAMALYYQSQEITKENIEYMEKMSEILNLNSQEAFEAFVVLVTNTLEVTDERVEAVKEIITNKSFVKELEGLKTKIEELDLAIIQGVEEKIFVDVEDVQDVIQTKVIDQSQEEAIITEKIIDHNIATKDEVKQNKVEIKVQDKITQKTIDNSFSQLSETNQAIEKQNTPVPEEKVINKNTNLEAKVNNLNKLQERNTIDINTNRQTNILEKNVVTQLVPKQNNLFNDIKKINQQINILLNLKKEIFSLSTNVPQEESIVDKFLGIAKFTPIPSFFNKSLAQGKTINPEILKQLNTDIKEAKPDSLGDKTKEINSNSFSNKNGELSFKVVDNKVFIQVKQDSGMQNYSISSDINNLEENVPYLALVNDVPKLIEKDKGNIKILQVNLNVSNDVLNTLSLKSLKTIIIDGKPNLFVVDNKNPSQNIVKPIIDNHENIATLTSHSENIQPETKSVSIIQNNNKQIKSNSDIKFIIPLDFMLDSNQENNVTQNPSTKSLDKTIKNNDPEKNKPVEYKILVKDGLTYVSAKNNIGQTKEIPLESILEKINLPVKNIGSENFAPIKLNLNNSDQNFGIEIKLSENNTIIVPVDGEINNLESQDLITELPNQFNQLKKNVLLSEYSQAKQTFNENIQDFIPENEITPVMINGLPAVIKKDVKQNNSFALLNNGENLPDYLEFKTSNHPFVLIKDQNSNNVLVPKLKVDNNIIKDLNGMISVVDKDGEEKVLFKDPITDKTYILPKTRQDTSVSQVQNDINKSGLIVSGNKVMTAKDADNNPVIIVSNKDNSLGIIKIHSKNNLIPESFENPLFINDNEKVLNNIQNTKKDYLGKFVFLENKELYNFDIDGNAENLILSNPINKEFNKGTIFSYDNGFIIKDDNKLFKSEVSPQLINDSEKINKGINVFKDNVFIYNDKGIKSLSIDEINKSHIGDLIDPEKPLSVIYNNKEAFIFKNNIDSSIRIVPNEELLNLGEALDFNQPISVEIENKKGIILNTQIDKNLEKELKFLPLSEITSHSEKVIGPLIAKDKDQFSVIVPDKDTIKVIDINKNISKFETLQDKLKVKIDGKSFVVIPDNKTGEHHIIPDKAVISKNNYDFSQPLKVEIDKQNYILAVDPKDKSLKIFSEEKCKNLGIATTKPIQTEINDNNSLISIVDHKVYKTNINEKTIKLTKDITEPVKILDEDSSFLINDKNSLIKINSNMLSKAEKLIDPIKVIANSQESLIIPTKEAKLINLNALSKFADLPIKHEVNENNNIFYHQDQTFVVNKTNLIKNSKEIDQPLLINKDGHEHLLLQGKKHIGFISKDSIIKHSDKQENIFTTNQDKSQFIFKDKNGNFKTVDLSAKLLNNPEKIKEIIQAKINNKDIVIVPKEDQLNFIVPNEKDLLINNQKEGLSLVIDNKSYNLVFDKEKPKLINFEGIDKSIQEDLSKPIKVSIDSTEYVIFNSSDNQLKILPLEALKDQKFSDLDIENINSIDISELIKQNYSLDSSDKKNIISIDDLLAPQAENILDKNTNTLNDSRLVVTISDGQLIIKKINKEDQSDINNDAIKETPDQQVNPINIPEKSEIINAVISSQVIKENKIESNDQKDTVDQVDEISEIVPSADNTSTQAPKLTESKHDIKISFDSLLSSVLSGKNNDKAAIESIKGLSLFTHDNEEFALKEDGSETPKIFNLKDQNKEVFKPNQNYVLAQNTSGKEVLIIKSVNNSFKTINIDNQFEDTDLPVQDEEGNIFISDNKSNEITKIPNKIINSFAGKDINQNLFMKSDNQLVTKSENKYVETNISNIQNENIDFNNPVIADIDGKENILIEHKGNIKQIPLTSLTGKVEKFKDNTIVIHDNKQLLVFRENNKNNIINLSSLDNILDPHKFQEIIIDNQPYKIINNKLVLNKNSETSLLNESTLSENLNEESKQSKTRQLDQNNLNINNIDLKQEIKQPIKVKYENGEGILYKDPVDKTLKFIDKKFIEENNLVNENDLLDIEINPNDKSYLSARKDSIIKFKIPELLLNKSNNIDNIKEIKVNGHSHIIVPNKDSEKNADNELNIPNENKFNKDEKPFMIFKKQDIIDNSNPLDNLFYVDNDDQKELYINSDKGLKSFKTSDLVDIGEKLDEPIYFENNNQVKIIKNNLGNISLATIDKNIIEDNKNIDQTLDNQPQQINLENTTEKIKVSESPKNIEQNILMNSALSYQIKKSENIDPDDDLIDLFDLDTKITPDNKLIKENKDIKLNVGDNKISFDSLLNSVLSKNDNDPKAVESIKELSLFTHDNDELDLEEEGSEAPEVYNKDQNKEVFKPNQSSLLAKNNNDTKTTTTNNELSLFTEVKPLVKEEVKTRIDQPKEEAEFSTFIQSESKAENKILLKNSNIKDDNSNTFITHGKDKKIIVRENGELKTLEPEKISETKTDKPILVSHKGENKILSVNKNVLINIDKVNTKVLYDDLIDKQNKMSDKMNHPEKNKISSPQIETIKTDILKTKEIINNIVNNQLLENPQDLSKQVSQMSLMFGALESQVRTLKKELEPFKKDITDLEEEVEGISEMIPFNGKPKKVENKKTDSKKSNHDMKVSFDTLLKSILSEVYSKVEKVSLNLQGREILSNNEKCFCIPVSIPVGQLRFNGEIMVKQEDDRNRKNNGNNSLSITLAVETKSMSTVVIDILNINKDLQISIKVANENIKQIFNDKLVKLNEMLKDSSYNIKPVSCSINQNSSRKNSLLVQRDIFPKSLKRINGII